MFGADAADLWSKLRRLEDCLDIFADPPESVQATIQEHALTSRVFYTPDPSLVTKLEFDPGLQERLPLSTFKASDLEAAALTGTQALEGRQFAPFFRKTKPEQREMLLGSFL